MENLQAQRSRSTHICFLTAMEAIISDVNRALFALRSPHWRRRGGEEERRRGGEEDEGDIFAMARVALVEADGTRAQ